MIPALLDYFKETFYEYDLIDDLWLKMVAPVLGVFEPSSPVVVISIHDQFLYNNLSKPNVECKSGILPVVFGETANSLKLLANNNPKTQFVVMQQNYFIQREIQGINNLHFITHLEGIWREYEERRDLKPVNVKELNDQQYILCLNNNPRPHRVGTVMYIILCGLDKKTTMSFMSHERIIGESSLPEPNNTYDYKTLLSWADWDDSTRDGFEKLDKSDFGGYDFIVEYVYTDKTNSHNGNVSNFEDKLKHHYKHTFVDIITETSCIEPTYTLTEKYINSVFGYSFPILIATHGAVGYIRSIGFDVFDDIINHSYDNEPNPFYRMKKAIDLNYDLLVNPTKIKEMWDVMGDRFQQNVNHYKNVLYNQEYNRLTREIDDIKKIIV